MSASALLLESQKAELEECYAAIADRDAKIERLARELELLKAEVKRLLGGRRDSHLIPEGQGVLFPAEVVQEDETPDHANEAPDGETPEDPIKRRNRPKSPARCVDASALPVEDRWHEVAEDERYCPETGLPLVPVGEKVFEEIEHERAKLRIVRHHRVIYGPTPEDAADRHVEPLTAPMPPRALEGCAASAFLLAWILVQKYARHLPLYRQEQIFANEGLQLPRQTMCDWVLACAAALRPIASCVMKQIRAGPIMQLDDTPVICQGGKGRSKFQAYLWTFVNPEVEGVAYYFTPGRGSDLIAEPLEGFEGFLVGDGYSGNRSAANKAAGEIVLAGCWAHVTRKFRDALVEAARTAQLFRDDIKRLYQVEDEATAAGLDHRGRLALRREKSRSILARILRRARRIRKQYSDAGKMAQALGYLLNQRKPLRRFLEDGRLPLDNNRCERSIRPVAVGRRNWLFAGSIRGGQAAATIYTLIECCRLAGVDMVEYLADVLVRVATHPASRVDELLPHRWKELVQATDAEPAAPALA